MNTNTLDQKTIVLSSSRAIRHEQLQFQSSTLFLPNFMTMSDFISKLCIVAEYKFLDEDSRILLLLEASNFKAFNALAIERNFFTFTKNSSYIFKFFEELSAELYNIENLDTSDIYAEYEEHIIILQELYKQYEKLCKERNLLDRIFLPKLYKFNEAFAKSHQEIEIYLDGHLTNFELELLEKCSLYSEVKIIFKTSKFNVKMQEKLQNIIEESFEVDYEYRISLNQKKVIEKQQIKKNKNIVCESVSETILQIAFIKHKIYHFIKKGYDPQNIAVILPDESIAPLLKSFDTKNNLNFAMGISFKESEIYHKLSAAEQFLAQNSQENIARLHRNGDGVYQKLLPYYYKLASEVDFIQILESFYEEINSKIELKIFEQEILSFKNILFFMQEMNVKSLLSLFLQRIAKRVMDDVRGGKITVMGVLETRGIEFDGVIVIDFNDSFVPKKSDKDMFLNTQIRKNASLPTMMDRENLQKHYYTKLFNSSKEVALVYVQSSESQGSRFLKQLGIKTQQHYEEMDYAKLLFQQHIKPVHKEKEVIIDYSFKDVKLSSSRLKIFLTCKRKYYYKYIQKLNTHRIPQDIPQEYEIGIQVHNALKELYTKQNFYTDVELLQKNLAFELDQQKGGSEFENYLLNLQKKRLEQFCKYEIERFKESRKVYMCEASLSREFKGITIIGNIDRIDITPNGYEVLDYKTGNYTLNNKKNFTDATDFQLEFYYLLAQTLGDVQSCSFYDLKEIKIVNELFLKEKLQILEEKIEYLLSLETINFAKCEDIKNCIYCEYATLCQRD